MGSHRHTPPEGVRMKTAGSSSLNTVITWLNTGNCVCTSVCVCVYLCTLLCTKAISSFSIVHSIFCICVWSVLRHTHRITYTPLTRGTKCNGIIQKQLRPVFECTSSSTYLKEHTHTHTVNDCVLTVCTAELKAGISPC